MLSREDNELLTLHRPRHGHGRAAPPVLDPRWCWSSELVPGGRVKRVQLLGERLIAFRDAERPSRASIGEFCPHRGASLYFGRNRGSGHALRLPRLEVRPRRPVRGHAERAAPNRTSPPRSPRRPTRARSAAAWSSPTWGRRARRRRCPSSSGRCCPPTTSSPPSASRTATGSRRWRAASTPATSRSCTRRSTTTTRDITEDMDRVSFGVGAAVADRRPRAALRGGRHRLRRADRRAPHAARTGSWYWRITQFLLPFYTMPPAGIGEKRRAVAHLGADGRHPRRQLDGDLAPGAPADAGGDRRCTSRARAPTCATTRRPPRSPTATCAPRPTATTTTSWTGRRTARGCSAASPASACRTRPSRRARAPIVDRSEERLGTQRHRDHPGAPAPHDGGARAARRRARRRPAGDPRSFLVRSASIALAAGEDWVDAVKPLVLVRPEQTLTLA